MNLFYLFSRVFLLKRQKVLQQQERNSIKRRGIMKLISSFFSLCPESEWCLAEQRTSRTFKGVFYP